MRDESVLNPKLESRFFNWKKGETAPFFLISEHLHGYELILLKNKAMQVKARPTSAEYTSMVSAFFLS